jgi:hypothetical protein
MPRFERSVLGDAAAAACRGGHHAAGDRSAERTAARRLSVRLAVACPIVVASTSAPAGLVDDEHLPLYPNARVAISAADHAYWTNLSNIEDSMSDHMKGHFIGAHRNLTGCQDQLVLLEDGARVAEGVTAIATPGHLVYSVTSAEQTMLVWGDLCYHQVLLLKRPTWGFPGRGHLLREGDEYTWLPLPLELD